MVKYDDDAKTVRVDPATFLVRIDGIILCKRIFRDGQAWLQFKDSDRLRSRNRGTAFVEVPLPTFVEVLMKPEIAS